MSSSMPDTYFAPAARDAPGEFARKAWIIDQFPLLTEALDAVPVMTMILNGNRQIVAANSAVYQALGAIAEDVIQQRPGEAVGCIRAKEGPGGCGTSKHCVTCGAVHAILESQEQNAPVTEECRILVETPFGAAPLDLKVTATPRVIEEERFIVVVLEDISQPKRLAVLQRIFFHDLLNTAGCVFSYVEHLSRNHREVETISEALLEVSDHLIEEIKAQRDLMSAESGDLEVARTPVVCQRVLGTVRQEFLQNPVATQRTIEIQDAWDGTITTDRKLVLRVLRNMLKNALEATPPGGVVTLRCVEMGKHVVFTVHNSGVMSPEVQLQVFQRSFSTKGHPGRGIGTYSVKLLGERYLGGRVEFESQAGEGTTFSLTLPKEVPTEADGRKSRDSSPP